MSYERHGRGGGYRKRYNRDNRGEKENLSFNHCIIHNSLFCIDDHDDRRQETPDEILKNVILKLGEVVSA